MFPSVYGVSTYFLLWGTAAVVCTPVAVWLTQRSAFPRGKSVIAVTLLAVALIVGAKALFVADFALSTLGDPRFALLAGGEVPPLTHGFRIPGGFIMMTLALPVICRVLGLPTLQFGDSIAPAAGLMMLLTRLGCFLNGCCHGPVRPDSFFALSFPPGSRAFEWQVQTGVLKELGPTLPVIPLQLYFASLGIALFMAGLYWQRSGLRPGVTWMRVCAGYFGGTLALESMREPAYAVNICVTAIALSITLVTWLVLKRGGDNMNVPTQSGRDLQATRLQVGWRRPLLLVSMCLAALLLYPAAGPAAELSASGTWSADQDTASGAWSAQFFVAGADVNGDFNIENFPGLTSASVSGTLVGGELKFGVIAKSREVGTENPTAATFTGIIEGDTAQGTYTTPDGSTGTWQGTFSLSATPTPQGTEAP